MGGFGCNINGGVNDSKFSEPMPWIGIYVAAASLACLLAMILDIIYGFKHRKLWFPCKFFSFNATSLTLLAVAIKLPVDLNNPMPRRQDQLTKISGTVFICTTIGNMMPSLGSMDNKEIGMNIMALTILVFTLIVNICIQMGTGLIYVFQIEHAIAMFSTVVLLLLSISSAIALPSTKKLLEKKFNIKHEVAIVEYQDEAGRPVVVKLTDDVKKYWMMSCTSHPQHVMVRSVTCTASGVFRLLSAFILAVTIIRSYVMANSVEFCQGDCDYKWSTILVLIIQCIAVGVGTIAPASRWFYAISIRCLERGNRSFKDEFKVERYWTEKLIEWKEYPFAVTIRSRQCRKHAQGMKNLAVDILIRIQIVIVLVSKFLRLASVLFTSYVILFLPSFCCCCCRGLHKKFKSKGHVTNIESESESHPKAKQNLIRFVLCLEDERPFVDQIAKKSRDATDYWIRSGKMKQPNYLMEILEKSTASKGFKGVSEFDSQQVPSLWSEETPNSWALPVVTLTSIAVALPNIDQNVIVRLLRGVSEGLRYVRLIEKDLDTRGSLISSRKAADILWVGVDLYKRWQGEDLQKMALEGKSPKDIVSGLADAGKKCFMEFKETNMSLCIRNPLEWPTSILAANSMYRIAQTILLDFDSSNNQNGEKLFERLYVMISDLLSACLTNLPSVIAMKCYCRAVEVRVQSVANAAHLLGEAEKILKALDQKALPALDPDQMAYIDEWRSISKQSPLSFNSSSSKNGVSSFSSDELHITIK